MTTLADRDATAVLVIDVQNQVVAGSHDRDGVVAVLEHVCFSCMISFAHGRRTPREVGDELERCARLLLP